MHRILRAGSKLVTVCDFLEVISSASQQREMFYKHLNTKIIILEWLDGSVG